MGVIPNSGGIPVRAERSGMKWKETEKPFVSSAWPLQIYKEGFASFLREIISEMETLFRYDWTYCCAVPLTNCFAVSKGKEEMQTRTPLWNETSNAQANKRIKGSFQLVLFSSYWVVVVTLFYSISGIANYSWILSYIANYSVSSTDLRDNTQTGQSDEDGTQWDFSDLAGVLQKGGGERS